jgi:hypothetical protein
VGYLELCPRAAKLGYQANLANTNSARNPIQVQNVHCCPKKRCWEWLYLDHREAVLSVDLGKVEATLKGRKNDKL